MNFKNNYLFVLFISFFIYSCGNDQELKHDELSDSSIVITKDSLVESINDTTKFKFDFAIANIPSPASTMQDLGKFGVDYDVLILNNVNKVSNYTTDFQKSINLGVYNIDLSYAIINNKGQDVLRYIKDVLIISDKLGLTGAVNNMVGKRAESNLGNKDSLFKILDEIFVKSDYYLRTDKRIYNASIIFVGSWIESLYLTAVISNQLKDPILIEKSRKLLWDQRFYLGNLINLLSDYTSKKECDELVKELKSIHQDIKSSKSVSDLNDTKFKSISDKIILLRNKMTK